jgi:hypothetical protein
MKMIEELIICDEARIPVAWLVTHEEARAEAEITMHSNQKGGKVWIWSLTSNNGDPGWEAPKGISKNEKSPFDEELSSSPEGAIKAVIDYAHDLEEKAEREEDNKANSRIHTIIRDPHVFLEEDMTFVRMLRDASRELRDTEALIICISPIEKLPEELKTDVAILRPGLPRRETLKEVLQAQLIDYQLPDYKNIEELTDACVGLTLNQATDALAKSITQFEGVNTEYISKIKTEDISSVPGLTYYGEAPSMDKVGGLNGLKEWLEERKEGFGEKAREENLPIPRGALFVGVSGCGKSLIAKAVADYFKLPLIAISPQDMKGGIVGETEGNIRTAEDKIISVGNSVGWIDEFEKAMPKQGDRNLDGGTSDAILRGMLTFMQERKGGMFIVATCNDISSMSPELLRKGRWDAIFFVDLPTYEERKEIFQIHLNLRNWTLSEEDIKELAEHSENRSGAEIEAACIDGKWRAFKEDRALTAKDIIYCLNADVPLFETMKEQIKALREWAKTRARPASIRRASAKASKRRKPGGRKISLETMEKVK